jgi:hypothetical protein
VERLKLRLTSCLLYRRRAATITSAPVGTIPGSSPQHGKISHTQLRISKPVPHLYLMEAGTIMLVASILLGLMGICGLFGGIKARKDNRK